jgi:hypothetical protein
MLEILNWVAALLALGTSIGLLLSRDWRWSLAILAAQYLGVFWLVHSHWPISMAAVKLVTGWMVCAALGTTLHGLVERSVSETAWPEGRLFRLLAAGLVALTAFALAQRTATWLNISLAVAWGSLLLIGMGLLHLGVTAQPLRVILGLLTLLAGFEIMYSAVESSALVAALLAVVNLCLALTGAYLLNAQATEDSR